MFYPPLFYFFVNILSLPELPLGNTLLFHHPPNILLKISCVPSL